MKTIAAFIEKIFWFLARFSKESSLLSALWAQDPSKFALGIGRLLFIAEGHQTKTKLDHRKELGMKNMVCRFALNSYSGWFSSSRKRKKLKRTSKSEKESRKSQKLEVLHSSFVLFTVLFTTIWWKFLEKAHVKQLVRDHLQVHGKMHRICPLFHFLQCHLCSVILRRFWKRKKKEKKEKSSKRYVSLLWRSIPCKRAIFVQK